MKEEYHSKQSVSNKQITNTKLYFNLGEVFSERPRNYLSEFHVFIAHFNTIPNLISEIKIDCVKAVKWFFENYKNDIKDTHFIKRYFNWNSKESVIDDIFYVLFDDLIVDFDTNNSTVRYLFKKTDQNKIDAIITEIKKFKIKNRNRHVPEINILLTTQNGIQAKPLTINKPKLKLEDNYNDDFHEIHNIIFKRLSKKNDKGLVLLHGKPGTGKTSYIRYLIASLKKDVIFLPPHMAEVITNPSLIPILVENPNSVFVIEDAENIIVNRELNGHSPVSTLLNITDGILSDCLNIQIICSFNTDLTKVDSALLRKGRLIAKYEFKELEKRKAQNLSDKLGFTSIIHSPMTLAAIYHQEEKAFDEQRKRELIGFRN